ncbi:MAG: undecaprenyl-diphosphate phosphatase [Bacillota bacterium]|nr:undecaprenyl-diphosphate phosphatase [Bacillota bacterium]
MFELIKAVLYGIVEGITEWLPISSTGHLILLERWIPLQVSKPFWDFFLVAIQLGAILAVVVYFLRDYWPFVRGKFVERMHLWFKIFVACVPAAVVGILFDDIIEALFYNDVSVAIALIVFGLLFLVIENYNAGKKPKVQHLEQISYRDALIIGMFQLLAAVFPGTSRSGATILGGLMIGLSRKVAAEFTFIMAIPVMFGASAIKLLKLDLVPTSSEMILLAIGMVTAFVVSLLCIRFLMNFIKKHDFKPFGYYRIALGVFVLLVYFFG